MIPDNIQTSAKYQVQLMHPENLTQLSREGPTGENKISCANALSL